MENKKTRITLMNLLMVIFGIILAIGVVVLGCYQTYLKVFSSDTINNADGKEVVEQNYNNYNEDSVDKVDYENRFDNYSNNNIEE